MSIEPKEFARYTNATTKTKEIINSQEFIIGEEIEPNFETHFSPEQSNETNIHDPLLKGTLSRKKIKTFPKKLGVQTRKMTKMSGMIAKIKTNTSELTAALNGDD